MPKQTYTDNSRGKVVNIIPKRTIRHAHNPNALKTEEKNMSNPLRDRPFNLKGGGELWFFVTFRIFFSDNTRVRISFFPEYNIMLYDKNSESDYFFFPPPKSEYFFQRHWESEYFLRKNHIPPLSS